MNSKQKDNISIIEAKHGKFIVFKNDSLTKHLLEDKDYEPHFYNTIKGLVGLNETVIDCGANIGYHTVTLSKQVGPGGKVYAFEPQRIVFQQLAGNVFLNGCTNVFCFNNALGDSKKDVQMGYVNYDDVNLSTGGNTIGSGGDSVTMLFLDEILQNEKNISFIKIDVQGCELQLINGALKLLDNLRPVLFIEIEDFWLRRFNTSSEELMNKLLNLNYFFLRILKPYPCDHIAVPLEKEPLIKNIIANLTEPVEIIKGKNIKLNFNGDAWNYKTYSISS